MHFLTLTRLRGRPARWRVAVLGGAMAASGWVGGAAAMSSCEGTFAAALLQPLPTPTVVALDIRDDSPSNVRMGARFLAGLREAGVAVGERANVVLHIDTSQLRGTPGASTDPGDQSYASSPVTTGGVQQALPAIPSDSIARPPAAPRPLLILRIEASAGQTAPASWVASVQCGIMGSDDEQRAQDLGRAIGGILGQRVERRPL